MGIRGNVVAVGQDRLLHNYNYCYKVSMTLSLPIYSRVCGDCTKCCEGWLEGRVHGHPMHRGRKCFYLEETCQIYEQRPENPCKNYNCAWLLEDQFPAWLKPSLSGVVVTKRSTMAPAMDGMKRIDYYDIIEAGGKLDSSVLNWLLHWAIDNKLNVAYELEGKVHVVGDEDFKGLLNR